MKTSKKRVSVDEIPELTARDFARAIPSKQRERILRGQISGGDDIVALRRFTGLTQEEFAKALAISVHTLRNWLTRHLNLVTERLPLRIETALPGLCARM